MSEDLNHTARNLATLPVSLFLRLCPVASWGHALALLVVALRLGSIPDGVIGILPAALWRWVRISRLTEMRSRNIS
jgi:hypothetical protein